MEKFSWENLRTLSLGPQNNKNFLKQFTGYIQGLTDFTITSYGQNTYTSPPELVFLLVLFPFPGKTDGQGERPFIRYCGSSSQTETPLASCN